MHHEASYEAKRPDQTKTGQIVGLCIELYAYIHADIGYFEGDPDLSERWPVKGRAR